MVIYPDIEIQNGRCVNRIRGMELDPTTYEPAPLAAARDFENAGAEWLHVIDVDASVARTGRSNAGTIIEIINEVAIPVQVGGGLRTFNDVQWWLDQGAARVVLGTAAVVDRHFAMDVCGRYPGQIVISITGKDGYAMIDGWQTRTSFSVLELAKSFERTGAAAIIYTDMNRFEGGQEVGLASTIELGTQLDISLISAGTVRETADVSTLALLPNIEGAVIGWALYEEKVDLSEAIRIAKGARVAPELAARGLGPRTEELAGIPVRKFDHVKLQVADIQRSKAFYEGLGFVPESGAADDEGNFLLMRHPGGAAVSLVSDRRKPGASIALEVSSLHKCREFLAHHDIEEVESPEHGERSVMRIEDPDHNVIELGRFARPGAQS